MKPRKILNIALLALTYLVTAGNEGCAPYEIQMEGKHFSVPILPQSIPGGGILGGVLTSIGLNFPFEGAFPAAAADHEKVTEIYLNEFGFRSTRSDDFNANGQPIEAKLKDPNRIGGCVTGQKDVNFIKKFEIFLQKDGSAGAPVRIAHYTRPTTNTTTCGFFMQLDQDPATGKLHNLKKFMPSFKVTTKAEGSAPAADVKLTGYVAVDWFVPEGEIVLIPADQDPNQNQGQ